MNIGEIIRSRRNIKQFKSAPVDQAKLLSWLQTVAYAPNHRLTEPWEILVIGPETRRKLNHKTDFGGAPVLLAVLSQPGNSPLQREENIAAVSCFIDNFLLSAWEEGVGTGWSSLGAAASSRATLGVPEGYDVIGIIAVGYPEAVPEPKARTEITAKLKYLD
ncbi:nitroreductase [Paenibacillus sp. P25]|nr:nitroreductase [Paenibacillus sp. P25]